MAASYLVQEEDGTSKFTLEEGGGSILLEESSAAGGTAGYLLPLMGVGSPTAVSNDG